MLPPFQLSGISGVHSCPQRLLFTDSSAIRGGNTAKAPRFQDLVELVPQKATLCIDHNETAPLGAVHQDSPTL